MRRPWTYCLTAFGVVAPMRLAASLIEMPARSRRVSRSRLMARSSQTSGVRAEKCLADGEETVKMGAESEAAPGTGWSANLFLLRGAIIIPEEPCKSKAKVVSGD